MQLKVKTSVLTKILNDAIEAIPASSTEPSYKNFLMKVNADEAGDPTLEIIASDGNVTLKTVLDKGEDKDPNILEAQPGIILVPARLLLDIVKSIDSSVISLNTVDTALLRVSDADNESSFNVNTTDPGEYPDVYMDFDEADSLKVSFNDFVRLYQSTSFATATKGSKQCFTGINIRVENGRLYFLATDACRLAQMSIAVQDDNDIRFTVSSKVLSMITKSEGIDSIEFELKDNKALFKAGNTVFQSRLYVGDFPAIDRITPKVTPYQLTVNTDELLKALQKVNLIVQSNPTPICKLTCSNEGVELVANSQGNSAKASLKKFNYEGDVLVIAFNLRYVTEAAKALASPTITLAFAGEGKIFLVKSDDPYNNQIITPIRTA